MTILLWVLPTVIVAIGAWPLMTALRGLADEIDGLRDSTRKARSLRYAWVDTNRDVDALRAHLRRRSGS